MRRRANPLGHISPDPALTNPDCLAVGEQKLKLRVCLTPTQKQVLFKGKTPEQIGCGTQACVYEVPGSKTRAIKLTADPTDVAGLVNLQKTGVVPKVYRTFRLSKLYPSIKPNVYQDYAVFAVEVERLTPLTEAQVKQYNEGRLTTLRAEVDRADSKLFAAGFSWGDCHGANIGYDRSGTIKILDVGYSEAQFKKNPKLLEDATRRFAKARRTRRLR